MQQSDIIKPKIYAKCTEGFGNQLRLSLAGSFLMQSNSIDEFRQEWVVNNHNNVNFLDYFHPLPMIQYEKLDTVNQHDIIPTLTFKGAINKFAPQQIKWDIALPIIFKFLKPKKEIQDIVDEYVDMNNIKNAIGLHVRRTCKISFLETAPKRCKLLNNNDILPYCSDYSTVFLGTDNAETQKWFKTKLKEKLVFYEKIKSGKENINQQYNPANVTRNTTGLHTVLDFLIFKQCKCFFGSNESSFSLLLYNWRKNDNDFYVFGTV